MESVEQKCKEMGGEANNRGVPSAAERGGGVGGGGGGKRKSGQPLHLLRNGQPLDLPKYGHPVQAVRLLSTLAVCVGKCGLLLLCSCVLAISYNSSRSNMQFSRGI